MTEIERREGDGRGDTDASIKSMKTRIREAQQAKNGEDSEQ